jgi:hypothetical protein
MGWLIETRHFTPSFAGYECAGFPTSAVSEPANPSETPVSEDQACGTSFNGGLIPTSVGTGLGSSGTLTWIDANQDVTRVADVRKGRMAHSVNSTIRSGGAPSSGGL